jgi:hypothetical protein
MSWGILLPILMIATFVLGMVLDTWIKARHGYPLTDDHGNVLHKSGGPDANRQIELLTSENDRLRGQVGRLEERIAVLERIATDPAERTAREIDSLR